MKTPFPLMTVLLSSLLLAACSDSDDNNSSSDNGDADPATRFEVSVVNLTNNQPLSPIAVISHDSGFTPWAIGSPASSGLEQMAEGGDNTELITSELDGSVASGVSGTGPVGPGGNQTISITPDSDAESLLTVTTMLVNTNDAFAGVSHVDVSALAVGESMTLTAPVYDSGTESNSEAAGTIPGPIDGGEGYNPTRDDTDRVSRHAGVVTVDGGLATSVLDESHRFDNPVMRITITRR